MLSKHTLISLTDSQLLPYGNGNFLLSPVVFERPGRNGAITFSHSFDSTLTNEFIFGPSTNRFARMAADEKAARRANKIGFPLLFPNVNESDYIPNFIYGQIANALTLPSANYNGLPERNINHTFNFVDNLSKVAGSHVIKTGVFVQRSRKDRTAGTAVSGNINFSNQANNPLNTGYAFANALLGIYTSYQQANNSPLSYYRYTNLEGYIQDNWKITPRFTLDYGLRIAWYQPQYDARLQTGVFNPDLYDRAKAVRLYEPLNAGAQIRAVDPSNRPGIPSATNTQPSDFIGLIVSNSGDVANGIGRASQGYPRGGFDSRGAQWGPRFGFAYNVSGSGKTIVRGGFGIFYDRVGGDLAFQTLLNPPTILTPNLLFGRLQELTPGGGVLAPPEVFGTPKDGHIPTIYSTSLGVQREIGFNTVVDVAYVATLSRHLAQPRNLNAIPYGTTFTRATQDPTQYGGVVPDVEPNLPDAYRQARLQFSGARAKRVEFLRLFPGYGNIPYREYVGPANSAAARPERSADRPGGLRHPTDRKHRPVAAAIPARSRHQ